MAVRSALGRFSRPAEAAPPESVAPPPDGVATALLQLRQAEQDLVAHNVELGGIRERIRSSQEARADCILAGDTDGALAAEDEVRKAGIRWEIESSRGAELAAAVSRAREQLGIQEWRRLQPRLHAAHASLHAAALALCLAIEEARNLEQAARNLGVQQVADSPSYQGVNGYVLGDWARQGYQSQQPQAA
jgi:hypothetical protein